jgi:hypothetical protein
MRETSKVDAQCKTTQMRDARRIRDARKGICAMLGKADKQCKTREGKCAIQGKADAQCKEGQMY